MSTILLYGDLDINDGVNYSLMQNGFKSDPPTLKMTYSDSPMVHGQPPTEAWKYNNRVLDFSIKVLGADRAGLETNIRALEAAVMTANATVTYKPSGGSATIYLLAYRPESVDSATFFQREYQDANTCVMSWQGQGFPFGHIDRQYLSTRNLGSNDSFEKCSGDDFEDWVETGGVTADASQYLTGGISAQIGNTGSLTDEDFLPVDPTHHYNAKCFAKKIYGSPNITLTVYCFDADQNQLDTLTLLDAYTPDSADWMDVIEVARRTGIGGGVPVITPDMWPDGTVLVKREINNDTGTTTFDSLIFEDSEYLQNNTLEGAFVIDIPAAYGDVPAPARITVGSAYCSGPFSAMNSGLATSLEAIDGYDASDIWAVGASGRILSFNGSTWASQHGASTHTLLGISALDSTHVWAVGAAGTIEFFNGASWANQTYPRVNPVLPDPGFEGTFSTYWQPTINTPGVVIERDTDYHHSGSHALLFYGEGPKTVNDWATTKASNWATINPTVSYTVSCYSGSDINSGKEVLNVYMETMFYNAAGSLIGKKTLGPWHRESLWHLHSLAIGPADYPAGTARMGLQFRWGGKITQYEDLYIDDITITQTSDPNLRGVRELSGSGIVAVGDGGTIIYSWDGDTWTQHDSGTVRDLNAVGGCYGTQHRFVAVGDGSTILTSNDGQSWTARKAASGVNLYGVFALDWDHIWAVGAAGRILFSSNGGVTWAYQPSGVTNTLYAVHGHDASHVWAVGDNGLILTFDGTIWSVKAGSGSKKTLHGVYAAADNKVWVVGDGGTILKGISDVGSMPMTNLIIGQRDEYADNFAPVQDANGQSQELNVYRRGQYYRSMTSGGTNKFRYKVGSHRGRYILSIGTSWSYATAQDQLNVNLYLETADGTKISATDVALPPLDLGDPNTLFKETAFQPTRLADITIPSHYISPSSNQDNIYQVIEVSNYSSHYEWLDCCTLIPVDRAVELSGMANNFIILDSEEGMVMSSQDGSLDTAAVFNPLTTVDAPHFVVSPTGTQFVVLAGRIVSGDARLSPLLDVEISYEPQYFLIPELET